ncbi:MAG: hypothetical protein A2293_04470 [Elusimicrobia bacterium RIFOXYB2_FULL_49_7]|nr:MAG: hypothetical protein A2293_04470 [Elusimicrobia bacterium RIFOXYB2_FULL_49_7]
MKRRFLSALLSEMRENLTAVVIFTLFLVFVTGYGIWFLGQESRAHIGALLATAMGTGSFLLFCSLYAIMILALIATFCLWIYSKRITKEANLWVGFAKETAHQFGTPVSSLLGWHDLMTDVLSSVQDPAIREKGSFFLKEMADDIHRMKSNVFRFSQIGLTPELKKQDLNTLLQETVAYFRERLPRTERSVQIIANYNELPLVDVNRELMIWVFENLLKNSLDAIERQEGRIEVETCFLDKEGAVRLTHSDNGQGVRPEAVNRIFNPGFSTKKQGWGLGLALCKRIVKEIHGGRIYLESTEIGRGSTFVVELPVVRNVKK